MVQQLLRGSATSRSRKTGVVLSGVVVVCPFLCGCFAFCGGARAAH